MHNVKNGGMWNIWQGVPSLARKIYLRRYGKFVALELHDREASQLSNIQVERDLHFISI